MKVLRLLAVPKVLTMLVLAVLSGDSLAAQSRDTRGSVTGTGVITGVVVADDADAKPVRRARVTCTPTDTPMGVTTITDDAGRFACAGLATGRVMVTATRDAWVATTYGAKRPMRPGTAVPVTSGEKTEIVLRMPRGAVITGTILDQNGQPASSAAARAMRYAIRNGERQLVPYGNSATTDDRGVYRIYGLAAGEYIVGASARGLVAIQSGEIRLMPEVDVRQPAAAQQPSAQPDPRERSVTIASTYYPGTTTSSQAGVVTVRAGEERGGVDFALQLATTARVEGTVTFPEGGTPPGLQVNLMASSSQATFPGLPLDGFRMGRAAPDGAFSFGDVAPGQYTVLARGTRPVPEGAAPGTLPQIVWASADVAIDGENVSGLALTLEPGLVISGQIRFESGTQKPPPDVRAMRVSLQAVQTQGGATISPGAATPDANGQFRLLGATPGRYRLGASGPGTGRPGGWLLKSATVNGLDTLDTPFVLQPNQSVADAVITFTDRLAQLTGSVRNPSGAPATDFTVVAFPSDQALWSPQSRRIQGVRPGADGTFLIRSLPAGNYLLAAIDDVEPGEWFDPAFLQRLPRAIAVSIADGEQKVQDIRLGPASKPIDR
jgi:carboxypeptidase family protein